MATENTADAIVRGPLPYFGKDGVLYMPGQTVSGVPAADVSADDNTTIQVQVEARNGDLRKRDVDKRVVFRPLKSDEGTIAEHVDTAMVATGQPDRLNVPDFLKQGTSEIVAAIANGTVDDFLGVIEQQETIRKGPVRRDLISAVAARTAALTRP